MFRLSYYGREFMLYKNEVEKYSGGVFKMAEG